MPPRGQCLTGLFIYRKHLAEEARSISWVDVNTEACSSGWLSNSRYTLPIDPTPAPGPTTATTAAACRSYAKMTWLWCARFCHKTRLEHHKESDVCSQAPDIVTCLCISVCMRVSQHSPALPCQGSAHQHLRKPLCRAQSPHEP